MEVKLISHSTPADWLKDENIEDSLQLVAFCARVSNPNNQLNNETAEKLVKYLIKHKHWSPLEMVSACMEITTTRDIARQILRHRSFSFQEFCISGDSEITTVLKSGKTKKIKIEDLYKRFISDQYWNMSDNLVKVYDEDTKTFTVKKIKEVFNTGIKPVYEVKLEGGASIKVTKDHKLLTKNGFQRLSDISIGDFVGKNGQPVYHDPAWLYNKKQESFNNGGLQYIADKAGVSYHTIRKWLKRNNLSYTKKEVNLCKKTWNKGLEKHLQPNYGNFPSEETRQKMRKSARKGVESNLYKNGNKSHNSIEFRQRVAQFCSGYKNMLLKTQDYKCAITGEPITAKDCQIDHIMPVYSNPELAFDIDNLQALSLNAHREKTKNENAISRTKPSWKQVVSIEYCGDAQTYDMEIDHKDHNYIANGIVTHNSQRYADPTNDLEFVLREARLQDTKNRQNSISFDDDPELKKFWIEKQQDVIKAAKEAYQWAISNGIAKEQARAVLPEGNTMSRMYMNGTIRSWIHYIDLRAANGTQKEHIEIAKACAEVIAKIFPMATDLTV